MTTVPAQRSETASDTRARLMANYSTASSRLFSSLPLSAFARLLSPVTFACGGSPLLAARPVSRWSVPVPSAERPHVVARFALRLQACLVSGCSAVPPLVFLFISPFASVLRSFWPLAVMRWLVQQRARQPTGRGAPTARRPTSPLRVSTAVGLGSLQLILLRCR